MKQWHAVDLKETLHSRKPIQIIDVRQPEEYVTGHIPGSKLIPLGEIQMRYQEIDPNVETVVVCRSGARSGMACDYLGKMGYKHLYNLMGGLSAWDGDIVRGN